MCLIHINLTMPNLNPFQNLYCSPSINHTFIILAKMSDSLLMHLEYTLIHHKSHVNAIAINPECDRLLSGGMSSAK